ncbi:uncharacterized protein M421DRAFT_100498 [Didymella exigua CBS 183.55]|uniref:Uncharacterized protein n=1 Tax=Didymella exigua CBS 183.55 TaxID=1150837 RepID=A0A6A5RQF9_9PLEO|nr:uncharacterized protein M421DRAFT_100498 [Didymella exigua CBS 183.55]KAF1929398.1 hypothetical protein M421DRAFT_100498 [Didymella exigua CBS 183.55]
MTGEKRSSDLSSRLSVKRGGKLISKTLGKSSLPPSISASPKAAFSAPKVKKDEVQRPKNSFHEMLHGSPREEDGHAGPASSAAQTAHSQGARGNPDERRSSERQKAFVPQDDRLAELENALSAAKEEIAALRHELDRVKQDAQASAEVSRYQAENHAPSEDAQTQMEPPDTVEPKIEDNTLEQVREQNSNLIAQNYNLRHRLAELQDQLSQPFHPEPQHSDSDWNNLTLRLHESEKESHARLQQLLSLKSSISSLTRTDSQVSDAELVEKFSQLANQVREWVVSNYRRSRMSFDGLPEASTSVLSTIKAHYACVDGADKLPLYQAIVSCTLMRIFDEPVVVGMPDEGIYAGLRAFAKSAPSSVVEIRDWKRMTLQVTERSTPSAELRSWKNKRLGLLANELENIMSSISSTDIASSARSALIGIMNTAADLQRILCLQKTGYQVNFFDSLDGTHYHFDDRTMESINDLEESMDDDSEPYVHHHDFAFCVFPCLQKVGKDVENIVFKARVCCGVG